MPNRGIRLNGKLVERLMFEANLDIARLRHLMDYKISHQTLNRILRDEPVSKKKGIMVAEALGVTYFFLLHPENELREGDAAASIEGQEWPEWETVEMLSVWFTASNGLQYRIMKMRDREVPGRFGRGKLYDLKHLGDNQRRSMRHCLSRHAEICHKLHRRPGIPVNHAVHPSHDGTQWLIVDEWIEGETLAYHLKAERVASLDKKKLLRRIAETLSAMHQASILRRELSPRFILLRSSDGVPFLTDFELGKLFEGSRTVSNDQWREDPYRAPEVETGEISPGDDRPDIYSWGRIAVHLTAGWLPKPGKDHLALRSADLPEAVKERIAQCTEIGPSRRPETMKDVLKTLRQWK